MRGPGVPRSSTLGSWPPVFGDASDKRGRCGLDDPGGETSGVRREAWPPLGPRLEFQGHGPAWGFLAWLGLGPHFNGEQGPVWNGDAAFLLCPHGVREGAIGLGTWGRGGALEAWARPRCLLLGFLRGALGPIPRCPRKCRGPAHTRAEFVQGRACSPLLPLTQVGTSNLAPLARQPGRDAAGPREGPAVSRHQLADPPWSRSAGGCALGSHTRAPQPPAGTRGCFPDTWTETGRPGEAGSRHGSLGARPAYPGAWPWALLMSGVQGRGCSWTEARPHRRVPAAGGPSGGGTAARLRLLSPAWLAQRFTFRAGSDQQLGCWIQCSLVRMGPSG